jgi:von Willebrand factor type A domain-containing protein
MRKRTILALGALLGQAILPSTLLGASCPVAAKVASLADRAPVIQLALLLDTSNSMDGLIDQARGQLWKVVNEFSAAHRHGRPAELQVALYEYGNNRLSPGSGYVRQVLPFTTDLDRVSEELFGLTTYGGEEYCGTVIQAALDQLRWSPSPADLKVVFIAGNEPFSQGPVDFHRVCTRARARDVVVNTIHCGSVQEGEQTGWKDGAVLAAGSFSTIDQNRAVVHVAAPQDEAIARLGVELNQTYVPYGAYGQAGQARQSAQDQNAVKSGAGSAVNRALTKGNHLYANSAWDLVDAVREVQVDLKTANPKDLPAEMQRLTLDQQKTYIQERLRRRAQIQAQISQLNRDRMTYLAQAGRSKSEASDTLDVVMAQTLRDQAGCKGIALQ